jgi:hypothetical protein
MDADAPLTLDEAAKTLLGGKVSAYTLRAAASRGELAIMRLGRKDFVTPAAIREWFELCQEKARARVSGSGQREENKPLSGSSETQDQFTVALAAAKMRLTQPKESSPNISEASTTRPGAAVVSIKSLWPT